MKERRLFVRVVAATILAAPFLVSAAEWAGGGSASAAAKKQKASGDAIESDRHHARRRVRVERQPGQRLGLRIQGGERREYRRSPRSRSGRNRGASPSRRTTKRPM